MEEPEGILVKSARRWRSRDQPSRGVCNRCGECAGEVRGDQGGGGEIRDVRRGEGDGSTGAASVTLSERMKVGWKETDVGDTAAVGFALAEIDDRATRDDPFVDLAERKC